MTNETIETLRERFEKKAGIIMNLLGNYRETWFKPDGTPLSDYELRVPDSWKEHNIGGMFGNGHIIYWCRHSIPEETRSKTMNEFDRKYYARQLGKISFESYLQIAVNNVRKYITQMGEETKKDWLGELRYKDAEKALLFLEPKLSEYLATPYSDQPLPPRIPYEAREITSEQLQNHLGRMEGENPSKSSCLLDLIMDKDCQGKIINAIRSEQAEEELLDELTEDSLGIILEDSMRDGNIKIKYLHITK